MVNPIQAAGVASYDRNTSLTARVNGQTDAAATPTTQATEGRDVYESTDRSACSITYDGETYASRSSLVDRLKAEQAEQTARFLETVKGSILKQASAVSGDSIWKLIAQGDYEVDPTTQKEAAAAIAEDGYWGVEQTSQRIVSFAKALTGGDASRLEEMRDAVVKGFEAAEKAWGGELPEIASQTYDAVMKLFDDWAQEG